MDAMPLQSVNEHNMDNNSAVVYYILSYKGPRMEYIQVYATTAMYWVKTTWLSPAVLTILCVLGRSRHAH